MADNIRVRYYPDCEVDDDFLRRLRDDLPREVQLAILGFLDPLSMHAVYVIQGIASEKEDRAWYCDMLGFGRSPVDELISCPWSRARLMMAALCDDRAARDLQRQVFQYLRGMEAKAAYKQLTKNMCVGLALDAMANIDRFSGKEDTRKRGWVECSLGTDPYDICGKSFHALIIFDGDTALLIDLRGPDDLALGPTLFTEELSSVYVVVQGERVLPGALRIMFMGLDVGEGFSLLETTLCTANSIFPRPAVRKIIWRQNPPLKVKLGEKARLVRWIMADNSLWNKVVDAVNRIGPTNTAIGYTALTTGNTNTAIGYNTNTAIGYNTQIWQGGYASFL